MARLAASSALIAVLALASCGGVERDPPTPDLRSSAEDGLRALGKGTFEVLDFKAGEGARFEIVDDYLYRTKLYSLPFDARVRCVADLSIPERSELDDRIGTPGYSVDDADRGLALIAVLGPGPRRAEATLDVHVAAVFDEIEPGNFRFRAIDRRRPTERP